MPRYKLTIAYDGTDFVGWQKQEPFALEGQAASVADNPKADRYAPIQGVIHREGEDRPRLQLRTVQQVVERAVREIVREPVNLMGASRTDAGVHARGQIGAFTCSGSDLPPPRGEGRGGVGELAVAPHCATDSPDDPPSPSHSGWPLSRGLDRLRRAINGRLPDDVQVMSVEHVNNSFDPISHCTSKGYSYTLHISPPPPHGTGLKPLWDRRYVMHIWEQLDLTAMQQAAQRFVGEHDFNAFAAAGHNRTTTVRTVHACNVLLAAKHPEGDRVRIEISGNGFLYNMVRIVAGTLVDVGRGRLTPEDITRIIAGKDRAAAGPTLPPEGLCLEWVKY